MTENGFLFQFWNLLEILFLEYLLFSEISHAKIPVVIIFIASVSIQVAIACLCIDSIALTEFFYSAKSQISTETGVIFLDNCLELSELKIGSRRVFTNNSKIKK